MFHGLFRSIFRGDQCALARLEGRQDAQRHLVLLRELDRADLQHLRTEARHFEHFLEGDDIEAPRLRLDSRIGRVDAVDVGEDLAFVGLERGGERDAGRVRTAAAEGRDVVVLVDALEAGNDDDATVIQVVDDLLVVDGLDPRLVVRAVGDDLDLAAGIRARRIAALLERHRQQRDRDLLAGGQQHVEFAAAGFGVDLLREFDQAVGFAAHRRDDDDHVVALVPVRGDLVGHGLDPLDRADRSAAVFLYQ